MSEPEGDTMTTTSADEVLAEALDAIYDTEEADGLRPYGWDAYGLGAAALIHLRAHPQRHLLAAALLDDPQMFIPGYRVRFIELDNACALLVREGWSGGIPFDEAVAALRAET